MRGMMMAHSAADKEKATGDPPFAKASEGEPSEAPPGA